MNNCSHIIDQELIHSETREKPTGELFESLTFLCGECGEEYTVIKDI